MKQSINSSDFYRAFKDMRPDNFTDEGLDALFNHLEQYEDETGTEIELDVIALCCEYSELTLKDCKSSYDCCEDCDTLEDCMNAIQNETTVIPVDDETFIIQDF